MTQGRLSTARAVRITGRVARLLWRSAPAHAVGYAALTLASAAVPVAAALLTKAVLDRLSGAAPVSGLLLVALGLAVAGVLAGVAPQLTQYLRRELDRRVSLSAQDELFAAVDQLAGLRRFEEPAFLDRLRLAQSSASSPGQVVDAGLGTLRSLLTLGGFLGALVVITPVFAGVVLLAALPVFLMELRLSRQRAGMLWEIGPNERWEFCYSQLLSSVEAAKEIRMFRIGGFLRGRMLAEQRVVNAAHRGMDRRELGTQSALAVLSAVIAGGGLVWAVLAAGRGQLTVGDVAMFVAAVAGVQAALDSLVAGTAAVHHQLLMLDHFAAVVDAEPDLPRPAAPAPVPPLRRGIELRDVWFRYSEDHPWILRGVDLTIPYGRSVALVGPNGAGKSTLVKLLCRFYDPSRGAILWDGVDLRQLPVDELRDRIATVFQDFMRYEFTARENVGLGDVAAVDQLDRIRRAAVLAGVDTTLSHLPQGYETLLTRAFHGDPDSASQDGVVLSGGQWQRLALARAYLRADRDLMILDEPSGGLDAEAEHDLHTRLRQIRTGRTSLLISHRLGAVRDADQIVVLDGGVLAEQGSHAELIARDGRYARLFRLQAAGYAAPATVAEPAGSAP